MMDFFEMERVIEELAKAYPAQCATTWFKITKNHKPSQEEYRNKVVEYMKIFEYLLATYPQGIDTEKLKELVKKSLDREIERVLKGDNKDVEKRYKHYVVNSPSVSLVDGIGKVSESFSSEKSITAALTKEKKRQKNDSKSEVKEVECRETKYVGNDLVDKRKRKKRSILILD
jgi:hypothetical protein